MASSEVIRASVNVVTQIVAQHLLERLKRKKKRPRKCWVRNWISRRSQLGASNTLIRELSAEDEVAFTNHFRMNRTNFDFLLSRISPYIQRADTRLRYAVPAAIKLQITLRYLATGESLTSLQYGFRVPKSTISKFLCEVLEAIYDAMKEYIKTPTTEREWKEIQKGFSVRWNFPDFIGAIDGKHVVVKCPQKSGSSFYNYKGSYSVILLALVDSNYCFTFVDIGAAGRESDGGVFGRSKLKAAIEGNTLNIPRTAVIAGDDAFPLKTYLMKPYARSGVLSYGQKIFNYRLSRARRIVENAFGILVAKFRVFQGPICVSVDKVDKIVLACCALHNWLRKTSCTYITASLIDNENSETGEVRQGSWREINAPGFCNVQSVGTHNHSREAANVRDSYCHYFLTTGSVPWQDSMV